MATLRSCVIMLLLCTFLVVCCADNGDDDDDDDEEPQKALGLSALDDLYLAAQRIYLFADDDGKVLYHRAPHIDLCRLEPPSAPCNNEEGDDDTEDDEDADEDAAELSKRTGTMTPHVDVDGSIPKEGAGAGHKAGGGTHEDEDAGDEDGDDELEQFDFAIADSLPEGYKRHPDIQAYPVMGMAVVPIYNLPGAAGLVLSPAVLAAIFSGEIRVWDDPRIRALNPGWPSRRDSLVANQTIEVVVEEGGDGLTRVFRRALATFDAGFEGRVGTDMAVWRNVTATRQQRGAGVNAYVLLTPYTIGYADIGSARQSGQAVAQLRHAGQVLEPSTISVERTLMHWGLNVISLNMSKKAWLTAERSPSLQHSDWPIIGFSYLIINKRHAAERCPHMFEVMEFWSWFLHAPPLDHVFARHHISALPTVVADAVWAHLTNDVHCGDHPVWSLPQQREVQGSGDQSVAAAFGDLGAIFSSRHSNLAVTYTVGSPDLARFQVSTAPTGQWDAKLLFATVAVVPVSPLRVTLDGPALAHILDGTITTWLHPDLRALNPDGIRDRDGVLVPDAPIVLLQGPLATSASLHATMTRYVPSYSGAAIRAAPKYTSEEALLTVLAGLAYSFSVALLRSFNAGIQIARFRNDAGIIVQPTLRNMEACAAAAPVDADRGTFHLHRSAAGGCYPVCEVLYLNMKKSKCLETNDFETAEKRAVEFVEWVFRSPQVKALLAQHHIVLLHTASEAAQAYNKWILNGVSCNPRFMLSTASLVLIYVGIGLMLVLLAAALLCMWRSTATVRELRKKFSNENMALACVDAMASLDFDRLEWLHSLSDPSPTQSALLRIAAMLKEVHQYIPETVLLALTSQGQNDGAHDSDATVPVGVPVAASDPRRLSTTSTRSTQSSQATPTTAGTHSGSRSSMRSRSVARGSRHSMGRQWRQEVMGKSKILYDVEPDTTKVSKGTYMVVYHYFAAWKKLDEPTHFRMVKSITAKFLQIVKAQGATVERVTANSMAVHWNIVRYDADGCFRAIVTAQQLVAERDAAFGEELHLRIGISHGTAVSGVVAAENMKLFLISGREASLCESLVRAPDVQALGVPVLISEALYNTIHLRVKAMPRLLHCGAVLWEPQPVSEQEAEDPQEWMYQLGAEGGAPSAAGLLLPVFKQLKAGAPRREVRDAVSKIKTDHAPLLTDHDVACLNCLLQTAPADP